MDKRALSCLHPPLVWCKRKTLTLLFPAAPFCSHPPEWLQRCEGGVLTVHSHVQESAKHSALHSRKLCHCVYACTCMLVCVGMCPILHVPCKALPLPATAKWQEVWVWQLLLTEWPNSGQETMVNQNCFRNALILGQLVVVVGRCTYESFPHDTCLWMGLNSMFGACCGCKRTHSLLQAWDPIGQNCSNLFTCAIIPTLSSFKSLGRVWSPRFNPWHLEIR